MVFSSHLFLFYFLPAVLLLYYLTPRRGRNLILTLVSYVFYGWANPLFSVLMLFSTLVDFAGGWIILWVESWRRPPAEGSGLNIQHFTAHPHARTHAYGLSATAWRKLAVALSVCSNLALLGFFKYFNFAVDSINATVIALGFPDLRLDTALRVILPLGISFYTFQSMSYIIDVYRGHGRPIRNFIDYACFVAMFPQLVAGPIVRFSAIAEQLRHRFTTFDTFARGAAFLCIGLAKKVLLANPCGKVADTVFGAGPAACLDAWTGAIAYAFQIYFDFSAYSDMAIGLGLMFGFTFSKNFDSPYRAASFTEFWRRWHISLSTWLRDYLYIPLGGNRPGTARTYLNLFLVMLLGGLWHGAAWNFVAWGAIHGLLLAAERATDRKGPISRLPHALRVVLTFVILLFTWVFFRAPDIHAALAYCGRMLGLGDAQASTALIRGVIHQPYYLLTLAAGALIVWACPQTWDWTRDLRPWKAAAALALFALAVVALTTQAYNPFIYFIF